MKKAVLYRVLFLIIGVLIIAYSVFYKQIFGELDSPVICNKITITFVDKNVNLISSEFVEGKLKSNNLYPLGKELNLIEAEAIESILNNTEMIKSSECYSTPSGEVYILIKQRVPKFRIAGKENYYIDSDRKKIGISPNYTAYVPIVSGDVDIEMARTELFDFIEYLDKTPFWRDQIEQIHVRADRKIELVPRVGENIILLGRLNNYEKKLKKLKKLYVKGFDKIGWQHYKTINLEYQGQIVCTKANTR